MDIRYKLIISNKNLYREIDIELDATAIKIGTQVEDDIRLPKDLFFEQITISLVKKVKDWYIYCSDNLYFSLGDVRKVFTKQLVHGDKLIVKYQNANIDVFNISFMINFDYERKDYNRKIILPENKQLEIGGRSTSDIYINDSYLGQDYFVLQYKDKALTVIDANTKYGIHINGKRVSNQVVKDHDFISVVGFSFYYKNGVLYTTTSDALDVKQLNSKIVNAQTTVFDYPKFNRSTRLKYLIPEDEIEVQQPSEKPKKPKKNLIMKLIPALIMLALVIVLRGIIGGGGTFVIYSAVSMSLGIIMSIVSFFEEKKAYRTDIAEREKKYNAYIEQKIQLIEESRENELKIRKLIYSPLNDNINEVYTFGKRIYERSQTDDDFLSVYLGEGRVESVNQIKYNKQEFIDLEDELSLIPEQLAEQYKEIEKAPIVSDFKNSNVVGVVGTKHKVYQAITNLTLDLSIRHFYNDVKFAYIINQVDFDNVNWVNKLRHVRNDDLDIYNIICDEESKKHLLEYFYSELTRRESAYGENDDNSANTVHYVVFIVDTLAIKNHPITKYFEQASKLGFTFVFFTEFEENLPRYCDEIIRLNQAADKLLLKTENAEIKYNYIAPQVDYALASKVAQKLSSIFVDEVSLEGQLTKYISLYQLLNIIEAEDLNLKERWANSVVYKSLAAPLGVMRKNKIVSLDISDKPNAHGPHGLVAGTTGSGKSEIIQTYILAMASLYHPHEVAFVIIDFKGGGMANQFKNLPHLNGAITNIDGREINRSLLSIKAELLKRQELLSDAEVNHVNDYIKLYKAGKVKLAMPHLIIIVDEFAELKAEHPDFMKELISAARIGRTLGVHLILATQKPAGVVDAQIWSNSKFKLCLKVQTREDSNEVLKSPLAAEIVEPGRAYFQVGNNEIFDLFQSAYSGADVPNSTEINVKKHEIYERNAWGKKTLKYTNEQKSEKREKLSQLDAIVQHIADYCKNEGVAQLSGICLPSLSDHLFSDSLTYDKALPHGVSVPIGVFDDPEKQNQGIFSLTPSKENIYIIGSSQMGKSIMLQTLIYGLIKSYTPAQTNLYLVDCDSMILKIFEKSAHVGGVVLPGEDEKCKNLFKLIESIIVERKTKLSSMGLSNYLSYLATGNSDMPLVVLAIDNVAAFKEYFSDRFEELDRLSRESQGVGVSLVITSPTVNALRYRTQSNFSEKIALTCVDTGEYSNLFGRCRVTPKEVPGRALCVIDKRILEFQTAIYGDFSNEAERVASLTEFIEVRNGEATTKAKLIPMVPEQLKLEVSMQEQAKLFQNKAIIPIGMAFSEVDYKSINLAKLGALSLVGATAVCNKFLQNFLSILAKTIIFHEVEAFIIDAKSGPLDKFANLGFVRDYTTDLIEAKIIIDEIASFAVQNCASQEQSMLKMLIINNKDVFNSITGDKNDSKLLADTMKNASENGLFVLLSGVENEKLPVLPTDALKYIKEKKQGVLFAPIAENKFYDVRGRVSDEVFDQSMAYYIDGENKTKIKLFE